MSVSEERRKERTNEDREELTRSRERDKRGPNLVEDDRLRHRARMRSHEQETTKWQKPPTAPNLTHSGK